MRRNTPIILLVGFGIVLLAVGGYLWATSEQSQEKDIVEATYAEKVVYAQDAADEDMRRDCSLRGGQFERCGNGCASDAEMCAAVCVPVCILSDEESVDTSSWEAYTSEEYDFSLRYPEREWNTEFALDNVIAPSFNFYIKPTGVPVELPLTHHDNISQFSVFPEGIPTEGLFGETREIDFPVPFPLSENSRMYVLEDGTPFAAYIKPTEQPMSWNQSGFVWMRLRVENMDTDCLRGGESVGPNECDPLVEDDRIVRRGAVDTELWDTYITTLQTLSFSEGSTVSGLLQLHSPEEGERVESPLTVSGEARGSWFFEGSFPVVLTDWDGRIIAEANATAEGEWTTNEFVPFSATLTFETPELYKRGSLILQRANPSGLPENDAAKEIVVEFE